MSSLYHVISHQNRPGVHSQNSYIMKLAEELIKELDFWTLKIVSVDLLADSTRLLFKLNFVKDELADVRSLGDGFIRDRQAAVNYLRTSGVNCFQSTGFVLIKFVNCAVFLLALDILFGLAQEHID